MRKFIYLCVVTGGGITILAGMSNEHLTPAQRQYHDIKEQYKDCILFFRMGDFYETFYDDASIASKVLDLTLTARDKHGNNPVPMAGVPYHSVDKYIAKLVQHGYKIAIAEQMTEAKAGQIVEREVTQVITPATWIEESKKEFVYIAAITYTGAELQSYHIARGDVTTGGYYTNSFATVEELSYALRRIQPREVIIDIDFPNLQGVRDQIAQQQFCLVSTYDLPADPQSMVCQVLRVQTLASFGTSLEQGRYTAIALLFNYLQRIQKKTLDTIVRIQYDASHEEVLLDIVTIKNLELISSQYEQSKKYSLLGVIDQTVSAMGARQFREVLLHPLKNQTELQSRYDHIQRYCQQSKQAQAIQDVLRHMLDIPKIVSSLLYKKHAPSTFGKLRYALHLMFQERSSLLPELAHVSCSQEVVAEVKAIYEHLHGLLKYDGLNDDIDYVNDGYNATIDELRQIAYHSDSLLLAYQQELAQQTGIANVKVKYISNQGYVLEITPKDVDIFETKSIKGDEKYDYIRRQTLKTGQRYTTVYLDELQRKVLSAQFALRTQEQILLDQAKDLVAQAVRSLQTVTEAIARVDVYTSHALFALEKKYVQPELISEGILHVIDGRHPVIEAYLPHDQNFIPNDAVVGGAQDILHIITGPNMGGKSTYLRQNALIVLLAHCGFYVPAKQAAIPLVDGIFARVGSGDVIAKNQSTFMTEMIEMANILHNATKNSFIILDELGRGTSTYDGLALAQAIVQYIVQNIGAKTLFATHYHELIALEETLPGVKNFSVSVYENDKEVVFMKKIVPGGASKSYGLDVAKIAGIPSMIVDAARKYLAFHEAQGQDTTKETRAPSPLFNMEIDRDSLSAKAELDRIKRLLSSLDPNNLTPMQALQMIAKLKGEV